MSNDPMSNQKEGRMSQSENPSAFPSVCMNDPGHPASAPGMSLRDWFAGQALVGFIASPALASLAANEIAADAYALADAMLAARTKDTTHD